MPYAMSGAKRITGSAFVRLGSAFVRRDANLDRAVLIASFCGGMRWGRSLLANCGSPLVTLCIYQSGLELGPTLPWLAPVPTWRARFDEISAVRPVGRGQDSGSAMEIVSPKGIMLTTTDGSFAVFWCIRREQVLEFLAGRGLKIETKGKRLNFFNLGELCETSLEEVKPDCCTE